MVELNREILNKVYGKNNLIKENTINILNNQISKIDSNTFRGLKKLNVLILSENEIEEIDVRLFESLSNLTELWLNKNKQKRIDSNTFRDLTKLRELRLDDNEIEEIEVRSFESLSNLQYLQLSHNKLKRIDSYTFKALVKLDTLKLDNNEIEEIEVRSFESLSNLQYLYLSHNKLKRIDFYTFQGLSKLKALELGENKIERIDFRSFDSLSNLQYLYLSHNKLKRIDLNTINGLTKLELLSLNHNEIKEIDVRSFKSLSNLKYLYLDNNKLKRINFNTFHGLTKLERLSLHHNEIVEIDFRLFESLSNLKVLSLENNKLKRIDSNTFKGLTKLERLNLCYNEIEEIEVRLFEYLFNLKGLSLDNNKLKKIDRKCFEPLKSIEVIEIYENVGLNELSFIQPSAFIYSYNQAKVKQYGSISEWDKFLQQFSEIEIATEIQDPYIGLFLMDRYKIKSNLGEGIFGTVYLVDDTKIDNKVVKEKAMKIMDQLYSVTENEINLFVKINHENIVRYFDHFHKRIGSKQKTFLITEYCQNGDLRKKIVEGRNFEERQILDWIRQSTNALNYLHSRKPEPIIHRDIKPENMLLNGLNEIKLGDLGLSKLMEKTHVSSYTGTPIYMSPEVFKAQFMDTIYYPNTDIWSLGCVLYELKFLTFAFPEGQRNNPPIPTQVSNSGIFSSILPKMLEKDCLRRITSQLLFMDLLNLDVVS